MKKLHVNSISDTYFIPEEGQRNLMCSNKKSLRCPSLSIINPNQVPEDVALDYYASILVEAYLDYKEYELY